MFHCWFHAARRSAEKRSHCARKADALKRMLISKRRKSAESAMTADNIITAAAKTGLRHVPLAALE
jgi:hypothetical protein